MDEKQKTEALQWHPAFYAGIQIEFSEEADKLIFENEHQLGTKPKEIDVLIIKKNPKVQIRKNIGRIFRTHNIVEYKSPEDYLSIDDYYKVCGYACFYKSDVSQVNVIKASEITISFVCHNYPRKLMKHLISERELRVSPQENGIYYITGEIFPVQLILTSQLSAKNNLWLKNLTNDLQKGAEMECLAKEYGKHQKDTLYKSVMNIIIRANRKSFEEEKYMCEAILELYKDEFDAAMAIEREKAVHEGRYEGRLEGRLEGRREGRLEGIKVMIIDYLEEGFPAQRILEKLEKRFGLTTEEAQSYFEQYKS